MINPLKKTSRFRGVTLPQEYENVIKETVEQDLRQPEDAGTPEVQNRLRKYGGQNVSD